MIGNRLIHLCSRLNLSRSYDSIAKCYHSPSINFNKYRRESDHSKQVPDNQHVERNDLLLDLNSVFKSINKEKKHAQFKREDKSTDSNNNVDRFLKDINRKNTYPNADRLVLDGKVLINDAIHYGYPKLLRIYYSDEDTLSAKINDINRLKEDGVEFLQISFDLIKQHSEVIDPHGVMGVVELNVRELFEINTKRNQVEVPLILVLNNVKDPGNMGTIIRSSLACGIVKVLCLKGCAKLLKGKVIRSTAGSIFQTPFVEDLSFETLKKHIPEDAKIYLSESRGTNLDNNLIMLNRNAIVYTQEQDDVKNQVNDQNEGIKQVDEFKNVINASVDFNDAFEKIENMKTNNYSEIDFFLESNNSIVLIANGETDLNTEIIDFIKSNECQKISIPMANHVNSLNTSIAASILMYEIKRQYLNKVRNSGS